MINVAPLHDKHKQTHLQKPYNCLCLLFLSLNLSRTIL